MILEQIVSVSCIPKSWALSLLSICLVYSSLFETISWCWILNLISFTLMILCQYVSFTCTCAFKSKPKTSSDGWQRATWLTKQIERQSNLSKIMMWTSKTWAVLNVH